MSCFGILKTNGLKLTPQRKLILDIIHKSGGHLTAEEIIKTVQTRMPGVNKSTIYRTLELLEELDCVLKSEVGDKSIYHHTEKGHHHHLICSKCGKSIHCDDDILLLVQKEIIHRYNFISDFKHIVITGLCRGCKGTG
jgi:Fur family transcriptional regulator, ferric uptake regulator